MKNNKRVIMSIFWLILGGILIALGFTGKIDEYWSGMGSALAVVGALQLLRLYRLNKNEAYREKMEIEISDERNQFIRNKAWAWAGYLFVMITAVSSILLRVFGQDLLSQAASGAVCLMLVLYWVCYLVLKKKY